MYGRCETDPFDQATDVCDSCYGEFCSACMVKTKGRKHPICKECAIVASGVRPGAKPMLRGSKKTATERRKTLRAAPETPRSFEYFDDVDALGGSGGSGGGGEPGSGTELDDRMAPPESDPMPSIAEAPPTDVHADAGPGAEDGVDNGVPAEDLSRPEPSTVEPSQQGTKQGTKQGAVTPALAALAQHQAERSAPEPDIEAVPAPAWLSDPVDLPAGPGHSEPTEHEPGVATPGADAPIHRGEDKPVTDGFDWVTELPARGTSTPLPSRSRTSSGDGLVPVVAANAPTGGAVATAEPPRSALPRRRSKLRPGDDEG